MKNKIIKLLALLLTMIMLSSSIGCTIIPTTPPAGSDGSSTQPGVTDPNVTEPGGENPPVGAEPMVDPIDDNYRTFYQIFVGSFSDGNNDGIGDLQGVINRMDYLNDGDINSGNDLGVQGLWLSPIFSSPTYHKYDAKDYYSIDWRFGTEDTLKELLDICHERNVKVILDLAINHTSDQHPWFLEFKKARMSGDKDSLYYDYYTCVRTSQKVNGVTYQQITAEYWVECNFSGSMPELNYDNPDVREAMLNVARYYLDLGVDGFRFDAVKYIYYGNTTKSAAFWDWYVGVLRSEYPDIYTVGECWSGDTEVYQYYKGTNCFNFSMAGAEGKVAMAAKGQNIGTYVNYVVSYLNNIKGKNPNSMMCAFLSNHDQDRIAGTFLLDNNMKMAANLYLLCSGSPTIYYGEEIGLRGSRGGELTDANRRLAMRWGDFDLVKNPVGSTYSDSKQIKTTVASQLDDPNSLVNHYSKVISIRHKYPEIARGEYKALTSSNSNLGGFLVTYQGSKLGILHNTSGSTVTIDISKLYGLDGYSFKELCDFVGAGNATLNGNILTIGAYTSVILK